MRQEHEKRNSRTASSASQCGGAERDGDDALRAAVSKDGPERMAVVTGLRRKGSSL
jgi:hypothetical protein